MIQTGLSFRDKQRGFAPATDIFLGCGVQARESVCGLFSRDF
jgi:hypothetical protein